MTPVPIGDPAALTRYIEDRYHLRHRQQLPGLVELAAQVESEHFGDHNVPRGLTDVLDRMAWEMEAHMKKEELILFPLIRAGEVRGIGQSMVEIGTDHDDHAREIRYIRALTNEFRPPAAAYRTWTALYDRLERFVSELREHIRLEDEVLFPQFQARH